MKLRNAIENYSKELDLHTTMTIESLIDSHRHLREKNMKSHQEWLKELEKAREFGRKQGIEMVTHGQYIEVSKLKSMTITELVDFIGYES